MKKQAFVMDYCDTQTLDKIIESLIACKVKVKVTIEDWKNTMSEDQRGYYFGVIVRLIALETGETKERVHTYLKAKYLQKEINIFGLQMDFVDSTQDLGTYAAELYFSKIRQDFSTGENDVPCQINIPKPNEIQGTEYGSYYYEPEKYVV